MSAAVLLFLLFGVVTAAAAPRGPNPYVFEELRKHKVNLAVLDALFERVFIEQDDEVKKGLEVHFRKAYERSFQDSTGWLHLAITSNKGDVQWNLIAAAWSKHKDNFPEVERLLRKEILSLMDMATKLKLRYHLNSTTEQMKEMKMTLQGWKLEMEREINATLNDFETKGWRSFLPKRLLEFEEYVFQNWMFPSRAVEELEERLSRLYPFRSFIVVSYTTEHPLQSCSNGSETGTLHYIRMRGKEWNLAVFSILPHETIDARRLFHHIMKVEKKKTVFRCSSQAEKIFKAMEFPCGKSYLMVAVVPVEEGMFKYAVTKRHWKQMKVTFVTRSFPAVCNMSYALLGIGGDTRPH